MNLHNFARVASRTENTVCLLLVFCRICKIIYSNYDVCSLVFVVRVYFSLHSSVVLC